MEFHGVPGMPTYVHHAVHDDICPVEDVDSLVDKLCSAGATIHYRRNEANEHFAEGVNSAFLAFEFITGQFKNRPSTVGLRPVVQCKIEVVNDTDIHIPDDLKLPPGFDILSFGVV